MMFLKICNTTYNFTISLFIILWSTSYSIIIWRQILKFVYCLTVKCSLLLFQQYFSCITATSYPKCVSDTKHMTSEVGA